MKYHPKSKLKKINNPKEKQKASLFNKKVSIQKKKEDKWKFKDEINNVIEINTNLIKNKDLKVNNIIQAFLHKISDEEYYLIYQIETPNATS